MSERIYSVATKSWPVVKGCDPKMPCGPRCWAAREVHRLADNPNPKIAEFHRGLTDAAGKWTGVVKLNEAHLTDPLRWRGKQVIASGYHGDLFRLPADQIDRAFAVMALCPQHVFLTLTKCAREMEEYLRPQMHGAKTRVYNRAYSLSAAHGGCMAHEWPFPNIYLGFSASNQTEFDARWPYVAKLAAQGWKTWVSLEPLIGPIELTNVRVGRESSMYRANALTGDGFNGARLSQCVLGGESGKDARPMHPDWVRGVRDQCEAAGVPFFLKQWGDWAPLQCFSNFVEWDKASAHGLLDRGGSFHFLKGIDVPDEEMGLTCADLDGNDWAAAVACVGKKLAGRTLDGVVHDQLAWEEHL